jgi:hypothetical protein
LLIRSPRAPATRDEPEQITNLDVHFWGVDYFEIPCVLRGIETVTPTQEEVERIGVILKRRILSDRVVALCSGNQRFLVVADSFTVTENQWDIFESPIQFRSHFRAK